MKMKITMAHLCRFRDRRDAACRRPGWGACKRCGRWAQLNAGGKGFRFPRWCDACLRIMAEADKKGGAQ